MTPEIIRKLSAELEAGITTEVQVVYVLAGVRKIVERDKLDLPALKFHCDWALHPEMDRRHAQGILRHFDEFHGSMMSPNTTDEVQRGLRREIQDVTQMRDFENELTQFLTLYELPPLTRHRVDGWVYFLFLYTQVIADIPLVVRVRERADGVSRVTVTVELANRPLENGEMLYKVSWNIQDGAGHQGEFFVLNSYGGER